MKFALKFAFEIALLAIVAVLFSLLIFMSALVGGCANSPKHQQHVQSPRPVESPQTNRYMIRWTPACAAAFYTVRLGTNSGRYTETRTFGAVTSGVFSVVYPASSVRFYVVMSSEDSPLVSNEVELKP